MPSPTILAASILFTGLVLHYQTDPSTNAKRAVLVDEKPSHTPRLIVPDAQRVRQDGTWTVIQTGNGSRPWIYDLSDQRLRVVAGSGPVTQSTKFDDHVPNLPKVLSAVDDLLPTVLNGSAHVAARTTAFIDYSGGALDVRSCFRTAGEYVPQLPGEPRCFAREVAFTPTTTTNWEIQDVDDSSRRIVFIPNAIVRITNDFLTKAQHQKHYSDLLIGRAAVRDIKDSDLECSADCTLIGIRRPGKGASIECSNNQWP